LKCFVRAVDIRLQIRADYQNKFFFGGGRGIWFSQTHSFHNCFECYPFINNSFVFSQVPQDVCFKHFGFLQQIFGFDHPPGAPVGALHLHATWREEDKKAEVGKAEDALEAVRKESQQKAQEIMQRLGFFF